jgi:DNA-binding transcriptional ArsR family regulator
MPSKYDINVFKLKAELCKTFADPSRLIIIHELRGGEKTVGQLVKVLKTPQSAASRHLAVLRHHGVVQTRREGVNIYYSLTDPRITAACEMVHEILMEQIARNKKMAESLSL